MKTKKGMASLYLVAFTTLLLGIVTMSFARVMISEKREASNSDLSQSAFDSALAGIEDAKTAIIMYEICLNKTDDDSVGSNNVKCGDVKTWMTNSFKTGYCDAVKKILNNDPGATGEVEISEKLNQAYTCVPIANDAPTYRSVLNEDTRSRVIPAKIEKAADGSSQYDKVVGIELQWFTPESNADAQESVRYMIADATAANPIPLLSKEAAMDNIDGKAAPILTFELFQTDSSFTMAELDLNNENNTGTDHAMIMLYPNDTEANGEKGTFVSAQNLLDASNKSNQAALNASLNYGDSVVPKIVSCGYRNSGEARCRATIQFPATYNGGARAEQTFLFRVSLPYGSPQTDFSIKPCLEIIGEECTKYANFTGAQYIVDSTGRASTLYRRIIARIETAPKFIFPEYAIQVSGNNSTIEKNFWVTENCWATDGKGNSTTCANNGDVN